MLPAMLRWIPCALCAIALSACSDSSKTQPEYESRWFTYPDSTRTGRNRLCEVNYYVSHDTLYTSEKYHFLSLVYSWDEDSTLAYSRMVFFDRTQTDSAGWYHLPLNQEDIFWREPGTHLSGIVLNSYIGNKYEYKNKVHADAYLYNNYKRTSEDDVRRLPPQLQKLLPIIK